MRPSPARRSGSIVTLANARLPGADLIQASNRRPAGSVAPLLALIARDRSIATSSPAKNGRVGSKRMVRWSGDRLRTPRPGPLHVPCTENEIAVTVVGAIGASNVIAIASLGPSRPLAGCTATTASWAQTGTVHTAATIRDRAAFGIGGFGEGAGRVRAATADRGRSASPPELELETARSCGLAQQAYLADDLEAGRRQVVEFAQRWRRVVEHVARPQALGDI